MVEFALQEFHCGFNTPLYIILQADQHLRQTLQQVSKKISLSKGKWLMLHDGLEPLENFLQDIHVPLDCDFLVASLSDNQSSVTFREVYQVHYSLPLTVSVIGNCTSDGLCNWETSDILQRGRNLGGIPKDRTFGSLRKNGTWTGLMGTVVDHEADIALTLLAMTETRLKAVDFFSPLWNVKQMVHIKKPDINEETFAMFASFSKGFWITLFVTIVVLTICLSGTWYIEDKIFTNSPPVNKLIETWHYAFTIFCMQCQATTPTTCSTRMIFLTAYFTAVVIYASYSATLISFLTIKKSAIQIENFEDLLNDGQFRLGFLGGTFLQDYFKETNSELITEVYEKLVKPEMNSLPKTELEGLTRACMEYKYSFVAQDFLAYSLSKKLPCTIVGVSKAYYLSTLSMVTAKSFPYRRLINHKIRRSGLLIRMKKHLFPDIEKATGEAVFISVNLKAVSEVYVILLTGIILSVVFLCLEIMSIKLKEQKQSSENGKITLKKFI
ncbi:hypothetical protein L9F63_021895 [Diploptera punctata]|uniref:Ionotropic glutamate receptor C-terminal domain-containing protein n=1 Tax=Diploptera punctata TaxID=6984 RepID=A0AAD7ZNU4_DIPPU|nr:hypothetical protein L9F63_021895 [Diploptera punctata]